MCGATSEAQDRVIEKPALMERSKTMTTDPFISAEIAYRQQRAAEQCGASRRRRHWVPRRPTLKLPQVRRPLQLVR